MFGLGTGVPSSKNISTMLQPPLMMWDGNHAFPHQWKYVSHDGALDKLDFLRKYDY